LEQSTEGVPVVSVVGGERFDLVAIPVVDVPADLYIVLLYHQTMYI
jgi:hypothetical protein